MMIIYSSNNGAVYALKKKATFVKCRFRHLHNVDFLITNIKCFMQAYRNTINTPSSIIIIHNERDLQLQR